MFQTQDKYGGFKFIYLFIMYKCSFYPAPYLSH